MLEINQTLIFQVVGYFVLLLILSRLLYRPVEKILKEREERIEGTLSKASGLEKEIEEGLRDYEKRLKEATIKGHDMRAGLRQEAVEKEREILDKASEEASRELSAMKKKIRDGRDSALTSLRERTRELSSDIAEKLLERKVVLVFALFVLIPGGVLAAEAEHGEGGGQWLWRIINFLILAGAVYFGWLKVIKPALEKRGVDIRKAIDDARAAKEAADKKAEEYRKKLALLEKRIGEVVEELRLEGEAEKKRMIEEAGRASQRLIEQAKTAAEHEAKKAREELKREAAELAVKMAEEIIRKEIKPEDQERLLRRYVEGLRLH